MGELSPWHWAVVILVLLLLFGAKRLPEAARGLGRSARILKAELRGSEQAEPPAPATSTEAAAPATSAGPGPVAERRTPAAADEQAITR